LYFLYVGGTFMPYTDFDAYVVRIQGGVTTPANVLCYAGTTLVGTLVFVDNGDTRKPVQDSQGRVTIYLVPSLLAPTLDVLRNEGPLKLYVDSGLNWGMLVTGEKEPVGEAEL
jgi:hypothetical protein